MALSESRRREALDFTKGVLILLIVIGHNKVLMSQMPVLRDSLYNWHVYSFFLITAVSFANFHRPHFLRDRAVRYYVPFVVFFSLAWLAAGGYDEPLLKLRDWVLGVAIGSADMLDRASGARLYWFLPALLGLTLVRWALSRGGRWLTTAVAAAGFLLAGLIPAEVARYLPLGIPIVLYVLGPTLAFGGFVTAVGRLPAWGVVVALGGTLAVFVGCTGLAFAQGSTLILASFRFFDVRDPISLFLHALLAISACGTVLLFGALLRRVRWIEWLGRASLLIYLTHQIAYTGAARLFGQALTEAAGAPATGIVLLAVTLGSSALVAAAIERIPRIRRILCPGSLDEWLRAVGLLRDPS